MLKSIDGGTGTFFLSFLKIKQNFHGSLKIKSLILEQPTYRKLTKSKDILILHPKSYYPGTYRFSLNRIIGFIQEIIWANKQISRYSPDIILGVDFHSNILIQINKLLFFRKIKTILTVHTHPEMSFNEKTSKKLTFFFRLLIRILYKKANTIVAVSQNLSEYLKKRFKLNSVQTIYHGINQKIKYQPSRKRKNMIISIGRLTEAKDFKTLIRSFYVTQQKVNNYHLYIIGDGPLKQQFLYLIKKLGLENQVKLLGWKNNIYSYLSRANLFILSSKREGFSYAILEAMSCGIPVISTDTLFGPPEILNDGEYGILVPQNDEQAMANATIRLLKNQNLWIKYAKKSLERSYFFSESKMLGQYEKIITGLF